MGFAKDFHEKSLEELTTMLAAQTFDHLHIQRNGLNAELEALHVRRGLDFPNVVGEVAETRFAIGQGAQPGLLQAMFRQLFAEGAIQYVPGNGCRWKYVGDVQDVRCFADRRHGTGHDGHMGGALLNLLNQAVFVTQGFGWEELHRNISFSFDDVLENDPGGPFF